MISTKTLIYLARGEAEATLLAGQFRDMLDRLRSTAQAKKLSDEDIASVIHTAKQHFIACAELECSSND
jgi:hypothetical protein